MKAVVYERYGTPDVLELRDIEKPVPRDNEVLIKVYSTTVTAGDWRMRKADPFLARLFNGLLKPGKVKILGFEISGVIEDVGKDVKSLKKGDAVFAFCGFRFGGYAEYRCLPENNLIALKPANVSFDEAAAVPVGGLTALRFLKHAGVTKNDRILIYGASGSVGTFAIQIAKYFGATVTAVCSTSNVNLVKLLGADEVIDYTREDFTTIPQKFNIIFDAVGKTSRSKCKALLEEGGKYISVKGTPGRNSDDMEVLRMLLETGKIRSVIDKRYTLDQIREAHAYVQQFHKKGNVVVKVYEDR
jgi:NADPH:quinone reductase-like Zn-dependent oxidoreductase